MQFTSPVPTRMSMDLDYIPRSHTVTGFRMHLLNKNKCWITGIVSYVNIVSVKIHDESRPAGSYRSSKHIMQGRGQRCRICDSSSTTKLRLCRSQRFWFSYRYGVKYSLQLSSSAGRIRNRKRVVETGRAPHLLEVATSFTRLRGTRIIVRKVSEAPLSGHLKKPWCQGPISAPGHREELSPVTSISPGRICF